MSTPLSALLLSIVIVPLSVLCHELGHFFSDIAFGFDSPTLHYASSGFARESEFWAMVRAGDLAAASEIARVTHAGISSALGLLISYLLVGMGLWGALGIPAPLLVAVAIVVLLAATLGGAALLIRRGRGRLVLPAVLGVVIGTVLWMGFAGPLLLP